MHLEWSSTCGLSQCKGSRAGSRGSIKSVKKRQPTRCAYSHSRAHVLAVDPRVVAVHISPVVCLAQPAPSALTLQARSNSQPLTADGPPVNPNQPPPPERLQIEARQRWRNCTAAAAAAHQSARASDPTAGLLRAELAKALTVRRCCACRVGGCSMLRGAWSEADKVQTVQATCMHSAAL